MDNLSLNRRSLCLENSFHHHNDQLWRNLFDFIDLFNDYDRFNYSDINNDDNQFQPTSLIFWKNVKTCSEYTTFVWLPFIILIFGIAFEWIIWKTKGQTIIDSVHHQFSISIFNILKMVIAIVLYVINISRVIYWSRYADTNPLGLLDVWSTLLADVIRASSWMIIILILIHNHRNRIVSSASIFIYLCLELLFNIYPFVMIIMDLFLNNIITTEPWIIDYDEFMISTNFLRIILIFYYLIIECRTDQDSYRQGSFKHKIENQESLSSFYSQITFSWFTDFVLQTWRRKSLFQQNLWKLNLKYHSDTLLKSVQNEYQKYSVKKRHFNMMFILIRLYRYQLLYTVFLRLLSTIFLFINPIMLNLIITFLNPSNVEPYWHGFFYASIMFISPMLESLLNNAHEYRMNLITMQVKTCINGIVYYKSLRLSNTAKQQFSTGEIVNLISVDSLRIVDAMNFMNYLWSAPLQILIGLYLVWLQLSYASLAGFSFMLLIIPVNILLTKLIRSLQSKLMIRKDARSKLMNEILNGIKVIKLNAWEKHFETQINNLRWLEIKQLKYIAYCNTVMQTFFSSTAVFVSVLSFGTYSLMSLDNILDANRAFVSLSLFNIIRVPLSYLPIFFQYYGIAVVSVKRINEFLNAPESIDYVEKLSSNNSDNQKPSPSSNAIRIKDGNFNWIKDDPIPILQDINLSIKKRSLTAIVGGVGCGKSSLLLAMLSEMEKLTGQIEIDGRIAYVPQEAWILNATIRDNILMNKKYDEKKYKKVLQACALQLDVAMFAAGDMTEVSEKGTNLSGGQKQRISLARAVYSNADIYLMDNPLSALDAHISQHIYDNVIGPKGILRNKTRVLITTKLSLLPEMDQIIYMSRGQIKDCGPFQQLIKDRGPFSEYVAEYFLDQQNNLQTDLDQTDSEFVNQMENEIKHVIERVQLSRSISYNRNQSMNEQRFHSTIVSESFVNRSQFRQSKSIDESSIMMLENISNIQQGQLIQSEEMEQGSVKFVNYKIYLKTFGWFLCSCSLLTLLLSNVAQIISSLWLSEWSNDSLRPAYELTDELRTNRIVVYCILGLIEIFFSFVGTLQMQLGCLRASRILHNRMILQMIRAPMSFFDITPIGRILNRFTKDIDAADQRIALTARVFFMQIYRTMVVFGLIGYESPIILVFLIPLSIGYYFVQKFFILTSRQLSRIEAVSRSPINNHVSETVNGITSIRSYGLKQKFIHRMFKLIDENNQSYWLILSAMRWLGIRLEFMSYSIVFLATLMAVLSRGTLSPGVAGLAISYSLNITSILNMFIRSYSDFEINFVSIERLVEYMELPKEKQLLSQLARIPYDWPQKGQITFENYSTQYRPGLKPCLKHLNLLIAGGSKIAIVGRTGSGKSSLSLALFRILEPIEGTIFIDDIDVRQVTLETLRRSLTIVPQDPIIFTASLRRNLDILSQYSDEQCLQALKDAHLNDFFKSINYDLNYMLTNNETLSVGQQQLICLARALLKRSPIIVFDEATASVDHDTDSKINETIFSKSFQSKTVFMIAHRLDNIMNYDHVLVMENGEILEYDSPKHLIQNQDGKFYSLAKEAKII